MIGQNGQGKRGNTGNKMGKKNKTSELWSSPENSHFTILYFSFQVLNTK
jgi:hypothetical protein